MVEIKVFGAAKEVTGSCYSLSSEDEQILVDCGMFQGGKDLEKLNYEKFGFSPRKYKALILTHAHLDHCGRIPLLVKLGFRGKIYCTDATKALAFIIMMDSANIAAEDTKNENKRRAMEKLPPRKPIYTPADVNDAMRLFVTVKYEENIRITKNIYAKFYDAGHILGSASVQVIVNDMGKNKTIVFSGDLGQENSILVRNSAPIQKADYIFMESTYGDRLHDPIDKRKRELVRVINETYKKGGKLMIPSFAVERTQELLFYIGQFMEDGTIPKMPVFLDSPMAIKSTEVFRKFMRYFNSDVQERFKETNDVFGFPELTMTRSRPESIEINGVSEPCIIIAGNGMCSAGRIKHHIANNISNDKNTLLFVGFQVEGTLGSWIKKGEKNIHLLGKEIEVNAKIESIEGFSAHADRVGLLKWLKNFSVKPKKIFIIHGDEDQQIPLSKTLAKEKYESYIPSLNETIEI
jgi:metallo-beta-lactamase family protein